VIDDREDFIRVYEAALAKEQAREVCRHIRQLFARGFGIARKASGQGEKTIRDDLQIFDIRDADGQDYKQALAPLLVQAVQRYVDEFDILANNALAGWWLKAQLTRKGEGYHDWHFEASSFYDAKRVLAWTIYLNDDYEGGELEFLYYARRMKPKEGDLVIFPGAFTHTHRGNMVLGGEKLILTGWYELVPSELTADARPASPGQ
jgi:hypothetical protein